MKSKYVKVRDLIKDYQIKKMKHEHLRNLESVGFSESQALKTLRKKKVPGLEKLKYRYDISLSSPGVTGVNVEDIKRTKEVQSFIRELMRRGQIEDRGRVLYFKKKNVWM